MNSPSCRGFLPSPGARRYLPGLALLLACWQPLHADNDGATPTAADYQGAHTAGVVRLNDAQQKAAGLVVQTLEAVTLQEETLAYGKVLDILPLLNLQAQMRAARADAEVAAATLKLTSKNRERITALHQADIIASRELATIDAQWQGDRAREEAARRRLDDIRREALHHWGSELARLTLEGSSELFEALATHRRFLIQITLPPTTDALAKDASVFVARDGDRAQASKAALISLAPRTDDLVQGETWFFHVRADNLRAGMRVNVWLTGNTRRIGVVIPSRAVVWYAGKPWVYRRDSAGHHTRIALTAPPSQTQDWFMESGLSPGDDIVISGAQTLLSEEFRGHIPDEDDD